MNDKFNDRIRQKLEDLQPTYREKDWVRMQSYLHQHGFPPAWSGASRWLQPVATGLTAASLLVAVVWQYQTNRELQTKLDSLSQTVTRLEQSQTALQQPQPRADTVYITRINPIQPQQTPSLSTNNSTLTEAESARLSPNQRLAGSTTQASNVPSGVIVNRTRPNQLASDGTSDAPQPSGVTRSGVTRSDAVTRSNTNGTETANPTDLHRVAPNKQQRIQNQSDLARSRSTEPNTPVAVESQPARSDRLPDSKQPEHQSGVSELPGQVTTDRQVASGNTFDRTTPRSRSGVSGERMATNTLSEFGNASNKSRGRRTKGAKPTGEATGLVSANGSVLRSSGYKGGQTTDAAPRNEEDNQPKRGINLAANEQVEGAATGSDEKQLTVTPLQPLAIQTNTDALVTRFNRRARRIKPATPSAPVTSVAINIPKQTSTDASSAEPESVRPTPSGQVRIGGAAEVGTNQQSVGAYGEVLLGRHWAVGIGLNRVWLPSERFITEVDFQDQKRHDFRRDFGRGVTYIHDILDINLQGSSWQLPISVSYRLPLKRGFVLTPSVGANLSVYTEGQASYLIRLRYIPIPQPGPGPKPGYDKDRIVELRQQQTNDLYHSWMVSMGVEKQINRFVVQASPYVTIPFWLSDNSLNNTSVGVRARVLFRF
ncbi:hypothetical protein BN8_05394 [Fibrisoma limi BUZ 3]|uniref:Outer membrane protein beta-barrel domain-containing protein n=1 Tax=Fibrisoma limi BUZ 3 TaxID=1185876 RepID=I2GQA6_9BACT|nr:hypothetical protein [Fibrisoma limi]CCH56084.1 hypothetical protein BN8_05394 [Fibrisoma limi BUZ 3]